MKSTVTINQPWLQTLRSNAMIEFEALGLPTLKSENWKYTARHFSEPQLPANSAKDHAQIDYKLDFLPQAERLVFIDGIYAPSLSTNKLIKPILANLDHPLVKTHLGKIANNRESGFMAFNLANFSQGYFCHITESLHNPLHIIHLNTGQKITNTLRNLIVLEQFCAASIVESYLSSALDHEYFNHTVTEIVLADNATLDFYKLQQESFKAQHLNACYVQQARDSHFKHYNFDLGGQHVRNWLQTNLNQENADCVFQGLYLAGIDQHIDNHTRVEHLASHTYSTEKYKGMINTKGRAVFNGQIYIAQDAQKIIADQKNPNLLLDKTAEINTKPQLEIYADDVKCSHGATIGQLDQEAIFYLQTRALDLELARHLVIDGFAQELIQTVKLESLQDYLREKFTQFLARDAAAWELK